MINWTAGDVMTTDVVVVRPETPYRTVVSLLQERRISAAPVIDDARHVLGLVSEADLLHKIEFVGEERDRRVFDSSSRRAARRKAGASTAGDLMSSPAVTVAPDTPVAEAARTMDTHRVKRLPVVDAHGVLVGIVSRGDLLRVHLRSDADITEDIRDALRRVLWVDPAAVAVTVADGAVTLRGHVDRKSTSAIAQHLAERVAGVTSVDSNIAWDFDDTLERASLP